MKKKHIGSNFEDFLEEEGILEKCRTNAIKFITIHELEKTTAQRKIKKTK